MHSPWWILSLILCVLSSTVAQGQEYAADYRYVAPSKAAQQSQTIPATELSALLQADCPHHVFSEFAGKNALLAEESNKYEALQVAENFALNLSFEALFSDTPAPGASKRYVAAIESQQATAMRLLVDLSQLRSDEALYVVDASVPCAFGPYTRQDACEGGRWLATIQGDTVHCILESQQDSLPSLTITKAAHFFRELNPPIAKAYPCPIPAACPTETAFQEVSTAIGMLIIPDGSGFGQYQCSGSLLNRPDTDALESYMLTANHCFVGAVDASQIEVIWDYRAQNCAGAGVPSVSELPHSSGQSILALDEELDGAFFSLAGQAPIGDYGRAWLGWDTHAVSEGATVTAIHHPAGASLKTAFGSITETDVTACLDAFCLDRSLYQNEVLWSEGITEGGSSGSPLLFVNRGYRVCGMLSNGAVHDCSNPAQNYDNFANFSRFFDRIACHLHPDLTCEAATPETELCPAKAVFGVDSLTVAKLRVFRDQALLPNALGRQLVAAYYAAAPELSTAVCKDETLKKAFTVIATPCALAGALLD